MIRRGKKEGWLNWPSTALRPWAELNGVKFDGISVGSVPGLPDRGTGVVAARSLKGGDEGPLMVIPGDLVLSLERIELQAKSDKYLREALEALGEHARVRKCYLIMNSYAYEASLYAPASEVYHHPELSIFNLEIILLFVITYRV